MFRLVHVKDDAFAILDTKDNVIDICSESQVTNFLRVGLSIAGISYNSNTNTFTYTSDYFINLNDGTQNEEDDDEDDDEDYDAGYGDGYDEDSEYDADLVNTEVASTAESDSDDDDYDDDYDSYFSDTDEEEQGSSDEVYDDYDADYDEDYDAGYGIYDTEVSYVNKLYELIPEEHKDLLKRYYLWSSQMLFDDGTSAQSNISGNQSKWQKLDALKNNGQAWVYAGFIDLERHGAGHCTFGHALRFLHYAWDTNYTDLDTEFWGTDYNSINWDRINALAEEGHVIKFGIDCIGDFFKVPKETLAKIKSLQSQALAELKFMYGIVTDEVRYSNAMGSFSVFESLADALVKEYTTKRLSTKGEVSASDSESYSLLVFYREFKKQGVLYPRSLVKRIQDIFLERTSHKFSIAKPLTNTVIYKNIKRMCKNEAPHLQEDFKNNSFRSVDFFKCYLDNMFFIQSGGIYAYNPYSAEPRDRDEGMKNKNSRAYFNAITGTNDSDETVIRDIMQTYNGYPEVFNQVRGSTLSYVGGFDDVRFNVDCLVTLDKVYYEYNLLKDKAYKFFDKLDIPRLVEKDGVLTRDTSSKYSDWDLKRFWVSANPNSSFSDFRYVTLQVGSHIGINTFEDLLVSLKNKTKDFEQSLQAMVDYIKKSDDKRIADSIASYKIKCASKPVEKDLRIEDFKSPNEVLVDEYNKQQTLESIPKSSEVTKSKPSVIEKSDNTEVFDKKVTDIPKEEKPKEEKPLESSYKLVFDTAVADVKKSGVDSVSLTGMELIFVLTYALENKVIADAELDSTNPVIRKILGTLQTKGGQPSKKQAYFLGLGVKATLSKFASNTSKTTSNLDKPMCNEADVKIESKLPVSGNGSVKIADSKDLSVLVEKASNNLDAVKNIYAGNAVKQFRMISLLKSVKLTGYCTQTQAQMLKELGDKLNF